MDVVIRRVDQWQVASSSGKPKDCLPIVGQVAFNVPPICGENVRGLASHPQFRLVTIARVNLCMTVETVFRALTVVLRVSFPVRDSGLQRTFANRYKRYRKSFSIRC